MRRIAALLSVSAALAVVQSPDEAAARDPDVPTSADTYADEAQPNRTFGIRQAGSM